MQGCNKIAISALALLVVVSLVDATVYETENPAPGTNWYRKAKHVGAWGGTCLCPDGSTYEVGDNYDKCGSLACEGGTPSSCESVHDETRRAMKVTCAEAACTCSNGDEALGNACPGHGEEVCRACNLGHFLTADKQCEPVCVCPNGYRARGAECTGVGDQVCRSCEVGYDLNEVKQCVPVSVIPPSNNQYDQVDGVGGWGGSCTCPDGQVYQVGHNMNGCKSLACEGGVAGTCFKQFDKNRKGMQVTCAEAKCRCSNGLEASGEACPAHDDEVCASCFTGYHLVAGNCVQNVCQCEMGIPARGADCPTDGEHVCVACTEFGFELVKSDGLETGTCEMVVQELCNCAHGTPADPIECTIQQDLVLGEPSVDSWDEKGDSFAACGASTFSRNDPENGAITLTMDACAVDAEPISVWTDDNFPNAPEQVVVTFKYLETCPAAGVPLAVSLLDFAEDDGTKFTWCLQTESPPEDFCDYIFPKREPVNVEHTFAISFHKYYEKYGKYPVAPKFGLQVKGAGDPQTTQITRVDWMTTHFYKNEEDDVCSACNDDYVLVKRDGEEIGFCQAVCTCTEGNAAEGEACVVPDEVCSSCTTPGFELIDSTCQAVCTCTHGVEARGDACVAPAEVCASCHAGFELVGGACQEIIGGPVESMPVGDAANAPSAAEDAIGLNALHMNMTSRMGSFSVAFAASFFLVGLFIGARAWMSQQYSGSDARLLIQEGREGDEDAA